MHTQPPKNATYYDPILDCFGPYEKIGWGNDYLDLLIDDPWVLEDVYTGEELIPVTDCELLFHKLQNTRVVTNYVRGEDDHY